MARTRRLEGKTAVVTGASSGVGRAIARALAEEGARVALIARNREGLDAAASEVRERGSPALVLPLDVADAAAVEAAAERVVSEWGHLDVSRPASLAGTAPRSPSPRARSRSSTQATMTSVPAERRS